MLALKVLPDLDRARWPVIVTSPRTLWQRYWRVHNGPVQEINPSRILGDYQVSVPYPVLEIGMVRMIAEARAWLLWLSILIFPTTSCSRAFAGTGCCWRWRSR